MSQPERIREIFSAAIEIDDERARTQFLDEACGDNAELRERVEALLKANEDAGSFFVDEGSETVLSVNSTEPVDLEIGPYKLREKIGEGGFGVVYVAEQKEPVRRKVALKVIKPGMDTKEVIARFAAERQALALMDHPHIARVLDAGTTDQGRPYFVMELVNGRPITTFCDERQLDLHERLNLFRDVCGAVQHAHQKGIIHRDIKPSNVLVTMTDGKPVVKVIDFGVAKALSQQLTNHTVYTQFAQLLGTPLYMSPEQAEGTYDIDTRTDVYSLGVLLYELLTGTTPFNRDELRKAGLDEIRRIIREQEPSKPSTKISTLGETLPSVAAVRKQEPRRLSAFMKGDLDWIVMKSLEKDRDRRYATASAFAEDIEHYLNHEAVDASPPSARYRFQKFARRHKGMLTAGCLIALSLVAGVIGTSWKAYEAERERERAVEAEGLAQTRLKSESVARKMAEQNKSLADERLVLSEANYEQALNAVEKMLTAVGGQELYSVPQMLPVQEKLLKDAIAFYEKIESTNKSDPVVKSKSADTYCHLGNLHEHLGNHRDSLSCWQDAARLFEEARKLAPYNEEYRTKLVQTYSRIGGSPVISNPFHYLQESLNLCETAPNITTELLGNKCRTLRRLAQRCEKTDPEQSTEYYLRSLEAGRELQRSTTSPYWTQEGLARTLKNYGELLATRGQYTEAIHMLIEGTTLLEEYGPGPDNSHGRFFFNLTRRSLAEVLFKCQEFDKSKELFLQCLAFFAAKQETHGELPRYYMHTLVCVSMLLRIIDRTDHVQSQEAEELKQLGMDTLSRYMKVVDSDDTFLGWLRTFAREFLTPQETIEFLSKLIDSHRVCAELFVYRGRAYTQIGEFEKVYAEFQSAFDHADGEISFVSFSGQETGREFIKNGCPELALRLGELIVIRDAEGARGYIVCGEANLELGRYAEALGSFQESIPRYSANPSWLYKRKAVAEYHLGQYADALVSLQTSLDKNKDDLSALTWISPTEVASCPNETFRVGMIDLATHAIELTDGDLRTYHARALHHVAQGNHELARRDMQLVSAADETPPYHSQYQLALLHLHLGDMDAYREACEAMLATFAESDKSVETHFTAWTCALASKAIYDYSPAIELAQRAVDKEPENQQYLNGLGAILMRAGKYDEAKVQLDQALAVAGSENTSAAYVHYFLAMTEHHLGNTADAAKHLNLANTAVDKELAAAPAWNRKLTLELLRKEAEKLVKVAAQTFSRPPAVALPVQL